MQPRFKCMYGLLFLRSTLICIFIVGKSAEYRFFNHVFTFRLNIRKFCFNFGI